MKKTPLMKLDLEVYEETMENGLSIYIVPNPKVKSIDVTFHTRFGAKDVEFTPMEEHKMIKVPFGIAHFLEHQKFNQPDGFDPSAFFSAHGADCNANTNPSKTTYLFSGPRFLKENLNCLLDYVQTPYFTDESVEKEKGIIEQEIMRYKDFPYRNVYETSDLISFVKDPIRYSTLGSVEDISKIKKEDLYRCYYNFYHPCNMFLVVTGNVNPHEVIEFVRENQQGKKFRPFLEIKRKKIEEPDHVLKEHEVLYGNVTVPIVSVNYKINRDQFKNIPLQKLSLYLLLLFELKTDIASEFSELLRKEEIIWGSIDVSISYGEKHLLVSFVADTRFPDKFITCLRDELRNLCITEEQLERRKKVFISSLVYASEFSSSINRRIANELIRYHKITYNPLELYQSLNIEELNQICQELDLSNTSDVILYPQQ